MPTLDELEEIRKRNLANTDSGISATNAVMRMRSALPGVNGAGSTPESNQANLDMASAMERSDRGNRFGFGSPQYAQNTDTPVVQAPAETGIDIAAVNERRNAILQGVDPDRNDIVPNAKRRVELQHELGNLTNLAHEHAFVTAKTAHENLTKNRDIEVSTQVGNILSGLADIPIDGSPESAAKILKLKQDNLLGFIHSPAVREELRTHAKTHDAVHQTKVQSFAESELAKAGLTPEEFATRKEIGYGTIAKAGLPGLSPDAHLDKWTNQYTGAEKGDRMGIDIGGQTFSIPASVYQGLNRVIPSKTAAPTQPAAQTQPAGTTATANAAPTTEVIKSGGHSYLIDHATKKTLRQID